MDDIISQLDKNGVTIVRFEQATQYGIPVCRAMPAKYFKGVARNGLNFAKCFLAFDPSGNIFENTGYGTEIQIADCHVAPDLNTFAILPWLTKTARVLVDSEKNGEKIPAYPRDVARRQLDRLSDFGLSLWSAHEHEFYLVKRDTKEPVDNQMYAYSTLRLSAYEDFIQQAVVDLPKAGVDVECVTSEANRGHVEITYRPEFGLKAADTAHTFKSGIKEIALKHNYIASFMSKPWPDKTGSSAHFCHSLWDETGVIPKLYDASSSTGLSEIGEYWVAGLLAHARAISVLMAPTVNCLKRFKRHSFAPYNVTWGPDNRTCAIRVKIQGDKGTYIENRLGASGCNPYISMAATIAAGLDGIVNKLPLHKGIDGASSAYDDEYVPPLTPALPDNMEEAVEALLADEVITSALGEEFMKFFVAAKKHEMKLEKESIEKGKLEEWERDFFFFMM
ncbi:lengsin-like [Diadema antillarum]|uniref:lengsin-like n=1 Tax=Diadema antillarum TaxID=105358 RepID=UPI003A877C09